MEPIRNVEHVRIPISEDRPGRRCRHDSCYWRGVETEWQDVTEEEAAALADLEASYRAPAGAERPARNAPAPRASGERTPAAVERRRRHRRVPHRVPVRFRTDGDERAATSGDVSTGGLFVRTRRVPEAGTVLDLTVDVPGRGEMALRGEVAWGRSKPAMLRQATVGFGVRLLQAPPEWDDWVAAHGP